MARTALLPADTRVVSVGLPLFAEALAALGVPVVHVEWRPPAGADRDLVALLERLEARGEAIERANASAFDGLVNGLPFLVDCRPAHEALALPERVVLHSGPPIEWERMCASRSQRGYLPGVSRVLKREACAAPIRARRGVSRAEEPR